MNLQELVLQIASWNAIPDETKTSAATDAAEAYQSVLERDFLKKGKALLHQSNDLRRALDQLRDQQQLIHVALKALEKEMVSSVDVPSGERIMVDISHRAAIQAFWDEARRVLSSTSHSEPSALSAMEARELKEALEQIPEVPKASRTTLYDPAYLSEESDDLLRYL